MRSVTFGFVGFNIRFGLLFFSVEKALWLHYGLFALAPGALGIMLGMLVHDGNPKDGEGEKKVNEKSEGSIAAL